MRNTHLLQVTLKEKTKDGKDQAAYLMRHNIDAIIGNPEGCTILMSSGVSYEVTDKVDVIIKRGKDFGLFGVV